MEGKTKALHLIENFIRAKKTRMELRKDPTNVRLRLELDKNEQFLDYSIEQFKIERVMFAKAKNKTNDRT